MVGTSYVSPSSTLHLLPASLPWRLTHTGHVSQLPSPQAFQGSSANGEPQKEFGGIRQREVGISIPSTSSLRTASSRLLSRGQSTWRVTLSAPPLLPRSGGIPRLLPSAEELLPSLWPLPYALPTLSKCPFIKFSWNYPNLNAPSISCRELL